MKATRNKIERQSYNYARDSAAERAVNEDRRAATVSIEENLSEPCANRTCGNACENATLKEKCPDANRRSAGANADDKGRRDDPDADKCSGENACSKTDCHAYADKYQRDDEKDESEECHCYRSFMYGAQMRLDFMAIEPVWASGLGGKNAGYKRLVRVRQICIVACPFHWMWMVMVQPG